jgi:transposase
VAVARMEEREAVMVDMRKDGMSYRQIAEATGVSHPTVIDAVKNAGGKDLPPEETPTVTTGKDGKKYPSKHAESYHAARSIRWPRLNPFKRACAWS